jgi:hypothetical protein
MRDSFLQQAFKLLDQHHQCGVVPLVCRLWYKLVPSTCSSLDVKVNYYGAAAVLTSWLERHNPALESVHLEILYPDVVRESSELLEMVCSRFSLQSLKIDDTAVNDSTALCMSIPLSPLTNLTSLELRRFDLDVSTLDAVPLLTQLRHLKLDTKSPASKEALLASLHDVAGSLLHLTSLDLNVETTTTKPHQLLPLTSLRGLKDLRLKNMGVEAQGIAVLSPLPITSIMVVVKGGEVGDVCSWLQEGGGMINTMHLLGDRYMPWLPEVELLMSHLGTCAPQLQSLSVSYMNALCDSTGLAGLTQLTRLAVYCNFDDTALLRLSALTGLRDLDIRYSQVTGAGYSFDWLASSLHQLRRINYECSPSGADARAAAELAFGSRVAEVSTGYGYRCSKWTMMLRPGVPASG